MTRAELDAMPTDTPERDRLAEIVRDLGHGGIARLARAGGIARRTIERKLSGESPTTPWDVHAARAIADETRAQNNTPGPDRAEGRPARAGSTAPDARAEYNVSGQTWDDYFTAYGRYMLAYGKRYLRLNEQLAREWWQLGTEPFEAAKHTASGTKPWAPGP